MKVLQVNGKRDAMSVLGIPCFSWGMDMVQTHYRIEVASDPLFENLVWDSGKTKSSSSEVEYPKDGNSLVHGSIYYSRATVWSDEKEQVLEMASFAINQPPKKPLVLDPLMSIDPEAVRIMWSQDPDPDGDKLSFFVEVESLLSKSKKEIGPLESENVILSPLELPPSRLLRARVRSFDGFCYSEWSEWTEEFKVSWKPLAPWFKSPSGGLTCLGSVEAEWEYPEGQQDGVLYRLELVSGKGDMVSSMGAYGTSRAKMSLDGIPEGDGYRLRIIPYSKDGKVGESSLSEQFSVVQEPSISCSSSHKGLMFFGTNDGRIVSAKMPYWNESLSPDDEENFSKSSSGAASSIKFSKDCIEMISSPDGYSQVDRRP